MDLIESFKSTTFSSTSDLRAFMRKMEEAEGERRAKALATGELLSRSIFESQSDSRTSNPVAAGSPTPKRKGTDTDRDGAATTKRMHVSPAGETGATVASRITPKTMRSKAMESTSAGPRDDSEDEDAKLPSRSSGPTARRCKCRKSRCLKLYCDCFAANQTCVENLCICVDCWNTNNILHLSARTEAIRSALEKNPSAFASKDIYLDFRGCHCRRSGCLKKYCECYSAGKKCTAVCRCVGCENRETLLF